MSTHPLRKFIQKTGFDIHRHRKSKEKIDFLKHFNIKTILDIGANIGQFATDIRSLLPNAFIYSFEPLTECFIKLESTMAKDSHFKAFHCALGKKNEDIEMEKNEYAPSSSILPLSSNHKNLFPHAKKTSIEKITVQKLDDIVSSLSIEKELLIKVDVQGFEDKVIMGGLQTFSKAKVVIIETSFIELYEGQPTFERIYEQLKSLGFFYKGSVQEKIDGNTGAIISEDSLFVR